MKGVPFVSRRYTKRVPFSRKMVCKKGKRLDLGPYKHLLSRKLLKKGFTAFRNFYFTNSHEVQTVHLHLLELRLLKIRKKNHLNKKTLLRFSQTCELLRSKDVFITAFFAAVNHNYDHKKRTLKHRNTQNGSKSTNHKSQTMTF